jgi:ABC-type transport system substrate-binding protein
MTTYWNEVFNARIARRRALTAVGAGTMGAAFIAACGGGDSSSKSPASGLVFSIKDESKEAKPGGTYARPNTTAATTADPHTRGNHTSLAQNLFSQLVRVKEGFMKDSDGTIVGDVIDSWEMSPDKLTMTMKLNPKIAFANIAPVNGRMMDVDDVMFSWERFASIGGRKQDLAGTGSGDGAVQSLTKIDANTIQFKLREPSTTVLPALAEDNTGTFYIVPKEVRDQKVDLRNNPIGTGPWQVKSLDSVSYTWVPNPGFKRAGEPAPYVAEQFFPVLPEYAATLAQFIAGKFLSIQVGQEDILPTKKQVPALDLMVAPPLGLYNRAYFGRKPGSPFLDDRTRQAYALTLDRNLYLETIFNVKAIAAEGIPVEIFPEGALTSETYAGWYLDPRDKAFGPNAKYFTQDIAEAKKLVSAAGFPNGIETSITYRVEGLTSQYYQGNDIQMNMVRDSGVFKPMIKPVQGVDWQTNWVRSNGLVDGIAHFFDFPTPDPTASVLSRYHSSGSSFNGADKTIEDLMTKAKSEFDNEKRKALLHELQRYDAGKNFFPRVGGGAVLSLAWPAVRNKFVNIGGTGRGNYRQFLTPWVWLDQTKAPFNKA